MLSKQNPEDAAMAIVAAAKAEADERRERRARGAPIGLRISGIQALPKRVQDALVHEAFQCAKTFLRTQVSAAFFGLICLVGWLVAKPHFSGAGPFAALLTTMCVSTVLTVATLTQLRRLLNDFKSSVPSSST